MKSPETQNSLGESDTLCGSTILIQPEVDQRRESRLSVNVWSLGDRNAEELGLGRGQVSAHMELGQTQGQGRRRFNYPGRRRAQSRRFSEPKVHT